MLKSIRSAIRVFLVLSLLSGFNVISAAEANTSGSNVQHVLILNSHSVGVPWAAMVHEAIRDSFSASTAGDFRLHFEYTGLVENGSAEYAESLRAFYQAKFRDTPLALIITLDVAATRWMLNAGQEAFPLIPTLFSIDETEVFKQPVPSHMLGVVAEFDMRLNVMTALDLHPDTRHSVIIGGADAVGQAFGNLVIEAIGDLGRTHQIVNLIGWPMPEILTRIANLPEETIIFYLPTLMDGAGNYFIPRRILPQISRVANAPIYGFWDTMVGFGLVGGYVADTAMLGRTLGEIALEVLAGKPLAEVTVHPRFSSFQYDWQQLQRWQISPTRLPAGSIVVNRELTLWEQYAWQMIAIITVVALLSLMVLGLFVQRIRLEHARIALEKAKGFLETEVSLRTASLNQANRELTASRDRFQRLVEDLGSHAAVYSHSIDGVLDFVGKGVDGVLGLTVEQCLGRPYHHIVTWDENGLQRAELALKQMLQTGERIPPWEMAFHRPDGSWGCVLISSHLVTDPNNAGVHFEGIALDITELKRAEQSARETKRLLQVALESSPSGILIASAPNGHIRFANQAALAIHGLTAGTTPETISMEAVSHAEFCHVSRPDGQPMLTAELPLTRSILHGETVAAEEAIIIADDGQQRWVSVSSAPILNDDGQISAGIVVFSDITQQKNVQSELQHSAHYDALTQLPNRVLLADRLNQAMTHARRSGKQLALVFIDLDHFKPVNDIHGHNVGDQLLIFLSRRMRATLRDGDTLARLGGDEFVAILSKLAHTNDAQPQIERLLAAVSEPVALDGIRLQVSGSVGVTFYPQNTDLDADQLLLQADQAMYQAKIKGRNTWQTFET